VVSSWGVKLYMASAFVVPIYGKFHNQFWKFHWWKMALFPTPSPDANVVSYRVFFRAPASTAPVETAQTCSSLDGEADGVFAESRRAAYAAFIADKVGDFIWHKHAIHLRVARTPSVGSPSVLRTHCLEGETSVGDAIDDEWVVTWLLFQLTTQFPDDDALVQVRDTDGEFLLIECADVLPEWVTPENSANRVFVRRGDVHLVSDAIVPESEDDRCEELRVAVGANKKKKKKKKKQEINAARVFTQSVRAIYDDHVATCANPAMQRILQRKLREAPRYMRSNRHRARCQLPLKAALVLRNRPAIIGAAVEAFYYREPRDATAVCNQMKTFPPVDINTRAVTMSRCQYAQLKQQHFFPPKSFLHLRGVEDIKPNDDPRTLSPDARAAEMGVKLACGLELLYAADECDQFGTPWRQIIDEAALSLSVKDEEEAEDEGEDDDAWLYVHPDTLEERLRSVATRTTTDGREKDLEEDNVVGGAEELQHIASMFTDFMGGVSGVDGVEPSEPVQLDMGAFMKLLNGGMNGASKGGLGGHDDEWDDPSDDDEDEGDEDEHGESSIDSDDELDHEVEDDEERIMREAMAEMDAELTGSTLDRTFTRVAEADGETKYRTDQAPLEDKPLDLDFNLLSNLLESMASQEGLAGPVSNILSELATSSPGKRV
jgi:hypothetical protein